MNNTRVTKDFTFLSSIHFEGKFMVNLYEMNASMLIDTNDPREQNVAIERMNYFLSSIVEECIFVQDTEKEAIEKYENAGIRVAQVPEEPYDQILGLILLNKCNAVMEDRIQVTDIIFGSKLSNLIKFELTTDMAINEYPGNHWWNNSSPSTQPKTKKKDKIVKLFDDKIEWADLELTWKVK
jgi:hypothetical protein